jgi:membrane protein
VDHIDGRAAHQRSIDFAFSWLARFFEVQGVDRAMAIAAQAFSALIPLLIAYSAVVPKRDSKSFADDLVDRFGLEGAAADTVRAAFTSSQTVQDGTSVLGLLLLIVSALAFTRGMQRLYEGAYRLPALGMRGTWTGLLWLALVIVYSTVRPVAADLVEGAIAQAVVSIALGGFAWLMTPYLLLGRRLPWRALLPGAALAALGMTALAVTSVIWIPRTFTASAEQFGAMGVAFALLSWLVATAFVLVITATGGAVALEQMRRHRT